ncbi:hypothetical protein UA08_02823 [Talaromyces atroroseus]|uniref:Mid2 domain-containing protein n=1 Tax=Talaromyces atroroseus TaxID=1441469 RepID=A0A225ALC4_TALAT|nr:hypothetical protein UA08_02823 [Talaromyces atroroseus]OKL62342.1 hypothetical protein UA08_02823 [Talaromyces atroroseus]
MSTTTTSAPSTVTEPPPVLTTVFTPASSCLIDLWQYSATASGLECYVGTSQVQCNYVQLGPSATTSCFPSDWDYEPTAYFSPGICPSGYETACSSVTTFGTNTETRATCCPSGYSCQTGSDWPWYTTDLCTYHNPGPVTYVYTTDLPGVGTSTVTTSGSEGINAYGVQIRFQATDSVTALTTTTASPTSSTSSTSSSSSTSTSSATPASTGLSTGAKAGIGVGVALAGLIAIAGIIFFFVRPRRRSASDGRPSAFSSQPAYYSELAGRPASVEVKRELYGSPLIELHNDPVRAPVEME